MIHIMSHCDSFISFSFSATFSDDTVGETSSNELVDAEGRLVGRVGAHDTARGRLNSTGPLNGCPDFQSYCQGSVNESSAQ